MTLLSVQHGHVSAAAGSSTTGLNLLCSLILLLQELPRAEEGLVPAPDQALDGQGALGAASGHTGLCSSHPFSHLSNPTGLPPVLWANTALCHVYQAGMMILAEIFFMQINPY